MRDRTWQGGAKVSLGMECSPEGTHDLLRAPLWDLQGSRKPYSPLVPSVSHRPPVPSPLQSVSLWAPGTHQVIRAAQQAGRGLRERPAEAAAWASSCLLSSRGQGREARLWGPLSACCPRPPSGKHRLSSSRQQALGRGSVLLPPRRHAPACTSSPGPLATMALPTALAPAAAPPTPGHCSGPWEVLGG